MRTDASRRACRPHAAPCGQPRAARIDARTATSARRSRFASRLEAGGPEQAVQAAQPTDALVTFSNSEVFGANIINYTSVFPHVWDDVTVGVVNGSELRYAVQVFENVAESCANITVRCLVPARERRVWATRLVLALTDELRRPGCRGPFKDGSPRRQIEIIPATTDPSGTD